MHDLSAIGCLIYIFCVVTDDSDVLDSIDSPRHQVKLKTKSYKMTIYWVSFLDGQQRVVLFTCDKAIAETARLVIIYIITL